MFQHSLFLNYFVNRILLIGLLLPLVWSCAPMESDDLAPVGDLDPATGKLGVAPAEGKADNMVGSGPSTSGLSNQSVVWTATRRWEDSDPAAGPAWAENTTLTWEEKFAQWVKGFKKIDPTNSHGQTYLLTTPWGKDLPAPSLECAENGMFLRVTFASWYGLPFFMEAYSPQSGRIYFGHFGIVTSSGAPLAGWPKFATAYKDHSARFSEQNNEQICAAWPKDQTLRSRSLSKNKDDNNSFIAPGAYSGAYFDEIFLNKRVGYFLLYLLTNMGSMHLSHETNVFNLKPEALHEGDLLVERWQRNGIGHVLVVKDVEDLGAGHLDADLVYGSMPRIQPVWYDGQYAKSYFISDYTGGVGSNTDGDRYAALGGGLKRWRTPVTQGSRWANIVPASARDKYISGTNLDAIAARPATFEKILGQLSPEEQRQVYLQEIEMARQNLRQRPASCANRQRREEAFAKLYKLNADHFQLNKEQTDRQYRTLEDYVFAELEYNKSKTCCWNSTTPQMYTIIMDLARQQLAQQGDTCISPAVFKAVNGGYDLFANHAQSLGQGELWVPWSADEPCSQASNSFLTDSEVLPQWTDFCTIKDSL